MDQTAATASATTVGGMSLLERMGFIGPSENSVVATLSIPGDPVAKARPRHGNGRTYTPGNVVEAEGRIGWAFRAAARTHRPDKDQRYGLILIYYRANRRRKDLDNMEKLVLDALNGIAWVDDDQVTEVHHRKALDPTGEGSTMVVVYRVQSD